MNFTILLPATKLHSPVRGANILASMLKKIIGFITVMVMAIVHTIASPVDKYPYVIVLDGDSTVDIPDSVFYKISRKVIFPVNKYLIPEDSEFRREIAEELMPYLNDHFYRLESVILRGAASPEGPWDWNVFLSEHRSKALLQLINKHSRVRIDESLRTVKVPEDYIYVLRLLHEAGDKDYDRVAQVVHQYVDSDQRRLKEELQKMDGGTLWRRLLRQYFPQTRAARVVLVFRKYDPGKILPLNPEIVRLAQEPLKLDPPTLLPIYSKLPRRELLSVKTNLLYDLAYMPGYDRWCPIPNVAIEYYPLHGHFTFGASIDFPWWQNYDAHKYFQVRNYQLEARYYFKSGDVRKRGYGNGAAFRGWYAQAYVHAGLYSICFDESRGWEGEGVGGGLGFGYVLPLGKKERWRLEFGAQFGYFWTKHDPYQYECPADVHEHKHDNLYYYKWTGDAEDFRERQHRFSWFGPTRVGITLSYDLLYRKRNGRGVGFKSWE